MKAKIRRSPFKLLATLVACIAGVSILAGIFYWQNNRIGVIEDLGGAKLGMSEVELTLVYGRKPDCDWTAEWTHGPNEKVWGFINRGTCDPTVYLDRENNHQDFKVTKVCSRYAPEKLSRVFSESDLIDKAGKPSSISISKDGTQRMDNFEDFHLEVKARGGFITEWCLTDDPQIFAEEYKANEH